MLGVACRIASARALQVKRELDCFSGVMYDIAAMRAFGCVLNLRIRSQTASKA